MQIAEVWHDGSSRRGKQMSSYEYKIVPAPRRGKRVKGAKTSQDRLAALLTERVNAEAGSGWEFLRVDSIPVEEKKGFLSSATETYNSYLVFRRGTAPEPVPKPAEDRPSVADAMSARLAELAEAFPDRSRSREPKEFNDGQPPAYAPPPRDGYTPPPTPNASGSERDGPILPAAPERRSRFSLKPRRADD